ncbi:MAG: hypothetical protein HYX72_02610 [Acidobacteria bacterium]|nr:hypothetical protein [Acidobacteriota bacterium]
MLRKLAVWILLIPLPLNGLWLACEEEPPKVQGSSVDLPASEENLFSTFAVSDDAIVSAGECARFCAFKSAEENGSVCLLGPEGKTSITILVFGVAVTQPQFQLSAIQPAGRGPAEMLDLYSNPNLFLSTPPPRI